jgi:hypothetical protein
MALHYTEFDSTTENLFADLNLAILQSSDWARLTSDVPLATTNAISGTASLSFASTAAFSVGQVVVIGTGAQREYQNIATVSPSQITLASNLSRSYAAGTEVRAGNNLYKATTTRGAQMVIDLSDSASKQGLAMAIYQSHDGTAGVGKRLKYLPWRYSPGAQSDILHVTLSLGKEHFFLMIEGPRGGESGAVSSLYGSFRDCAFLSDVVPYDEEDAVPVVVAGGANTFSASGSSVGNSSHLAHVSRNLQATANWAPVRLASLQFLSAGEDEVINVQRQRELDGRFILTPYVVFADESGMRGRLSSLFFAGFSQSSDHAVPPPQLGSKVQYQGLWYKLLAVNKGDGNRSVWGPLGAVQNENASSFARSVVVGVPCPP